MSEKIEVLFWPDNTWCRKEDLFAQLQYKSDDYSRLSVPIEFSDEEIDNEVMLINADLMLLWQNNQLNR